MSEPPGSSSIPNPMQSAVGSPTSGSSSGLYTMGRIEVACPECQTGLRVRAKYSGRYVRCEKCRAKFLVESAKDATPNPPHTTPDPDDPWQGRAEVMRLLDEIQALRASNSQLQARLDRVTAERDEAAATLRRLSPPEHLYSVLDSQSSFPAVDTSGTVQRS